MSLILALTGTPGTGKTAVARELRKALYVINLTRFARKCGALGRYIAEEDTFEIDIEVLDKKIAIACKEANAEVLIIEGHLSHLLSCINAIVVLRCAPSLLYERLKKKGWRVRKIWENVEAEAIDLILVEALSTGKNVWEIDTTAKSPAETANAIFEIIAGKGEKYKPGGINWSEDFLALIARKENVRKLQKKGRPMAFKNC